MNHPVKPVRVVLADDHVLVRAGIRALLEKLPGTEVAGEAGDGREVLNLVATLRPDVVLMDITMPGLNGLEAAARLAHDFPDVRVIILSMHDTEELVHKVLEAGARGFVLKSDAGRELVAADFGAGENAPTLAGTFTVAPPAGVTVEPAAAALTNVLASAGCSRHRDAVDARLIEAVRSWGTQGKIIHSEAEVGGIDGHTNRPSP